MDSISNIFRGFNLRDRLLAFFIHVGLSLPIYIVLLWVVRQFWYPDFYYQVLGITSILIVLFLVDVVLGPLLTFMVYKKNKPSLKFDLSVIVIFQLAALAYGVSVIYKERPLYLVYAIDRFVVVIAGTEGVNVDDVKYPELKAGLPKVVATDFPETEKERNDLLFGSLEGGPDMEHFSHLYRPIEQVSKVMEANGIHLNKISSETLAEINKRWSSLPHDNLRAFPLVSPKVSDKLLVWDLKNQKMLGLIDVDPWSVIKN